VLLRGTSAWNYHLPYLSQKVCGFHCFVYEYYCLLDGDMLHSGGHAPCIGAACSSETAVNLIPESGNIPSSNLCKKRRKV